jgi:hypothetical protein
MNEAVKIGSYEDAKSLVETEGLVEVKNLAETEGLVEAESIAIVSSLTKLERGYSLESNEVRERNKCEMLKISNEVRGM